MANLLVVSKAGTVGKSTLASVVIAPRFGCDEVIAIETENAAGALFAQGVTRFTAERYGAFLEYMIALEDEGKNTVTDLGASNYVPFLRNLALGDGVQYFDYVVVVTDTQERCQQDAIDTIQQFFKLGLPPDRLRIVLNKSKPATESLSIEQQFETIFAAAEVDPRIKVDPECNMPGLEIFDQMSFNGINWPELLADTTDYTARLRATVGDGPTKPRLKSVAYRIAHKAKGKTIEFSDQLFRALNVGPLNGTPAVPTAIHIMTATIEDSRRDAGKHSSTDKPWTAKA